MSNKLKEQYDSLYASKDVVFGEGEPVKVVCKVADFLKKGTVLDIGGGEGRNAIYLADKGFDVSVVDISEVGINKLKSVAENRNLKIKTKVSDVLVDGIDGEYDLIINTFVLHHVDVSDAKDLIVNTQRHTNKNGFNIIVTFTNNGDLYKRNEKSGRFYPNEEVLRSLYKDWDIRRIFTFESTTHARDKEGNRMKNYVIALVAVKR